MRCYICDSDSDSVSFDREHREFGPCAACQVAIYECVISYDPVDEDILEIEDVGC